MIMVIPWGRVPFVVLLTCFVAGDVRAQLIYDMIDLGTLGGAWSKAWDINNSSQIAGTAYTDAQFDHAALWEHPLGPVDLGTLGGATSRAHAINDAGAIVGYADTDAGLQHACLWAGDSVIDLGTLGGSSSTAWDTTSPPPAR